MKSFEGYLKEKLGDSYVLLAGGGEKSLNDFYIDGLGYSAQSDSSQFACGSFGIGGTNVTTNPFPGTYGAYINLSGKILYRPQLFMQYDAKRLWLRSTVWDGTVTNWHEVAFIDTKVNSAVQADNADTVDNLHASNLVRFFLSPLTSDGPADSAKSWFTETMPSASGAIVYNVPGSEKTIIAGKSSGAYGHMLQLNYDDNYLRLLRYQGGSWKTTDWEKISAGYADSAGYASNYLANRQSIGSGDQNHAQAIQSYFDNYKSSIPRDCLTANYSNSYGNGSLYFGYFLSGYDSTPYGGFYVCHYSTPYYVGIENGSYSQQQIITSSSIGSQSVNYATSAGNSDTVDGLHVHVGRNYEANKIVRTDDYGYIQCGYINSSSGNEGNNSSPARVWGTNGSDDYLRTYITSALSVGYASSAGYANQLQAFVNDDFTNGSHFIKAIRDPNGWAMRLWTCYNGGAKQSTAVYVGYADSAGNADTIDSEHASAFAHVAAANNLVHAGNEITMIPDSYNGNLWFNYQSVSRNSSSNITGYIFGNGSGGSLASITSGTFNGNCTGSAGYASRAAYLDGHNTNPDNSHPGYGARIFYSWDIGQAYNASSGYSNGITIGSNPGDQAYGFQIVQNMWDDNTYTRRYNGGWQEWRTLLNNTNYPSYIDGRYLRYEGWWSSGSGQNVNDAEGMIFVYSDHGSPSGWGVLSTFSYERGSGYKMQLFSDGYTDGYTYYRNKSSDRGGWGSWVRILDSTNWTSIIDGRYLPLSGGTISGVITFAANDNYGLAATANYSQIGFVDRYFWKCHVSNMCTDTIYSRNETGAPNFPNGLTSGANITAVNFYTTSDRLKKQNISSFSEHIRKFQLKDTEKWHYGVIAQEVPEMFRDGEEGSMTVNYNSILSYYVGCLENKVAKLEQKIKYLENK